MAPTCFAYYGGLAAVWVIRVYISITFAFRLLANGFRIIANYSTKIGHNIKSSHLKFPFTFDPFYLLRTAPEACSLQQKVKWYVWSSDPDGSYGKIVDSIKSCFGISYVTCVKVIFCNFWLGGSVPRRPSFSRTYFKCCLDNELCNNSKWANSSRGWLPGNKTQ